MEYNIGKSTKSIGNTVFGLLIRTHINLKIFAISALFNLSWYDLLVLLEICIVKKPTHIATLCNMNDPKSGQDVQTILVLS